MMNKEIEASLEQLHQELEKLAPAIEHIDLLRNVIDTVESIPNRHLELIDSLKEIDSEFKKDTLDFVKEQIDKTLDINSKLNEELNVLNSSNESLIKELSLYSSKIQDYLSKIEDIDFPSRLSSIEADINSSSSALNNLQGSLNNMQAEQNRNSDKIITKAEKAHDAVNSMSESLKVELSDVKKELKTTKIISFALVGLMLIALGFLVFK